MPNIKWYGIQDLYTIEKYKIKTLTTCLTTILLLNNLLERHPSVSAVNPPAIANINKKTPLIVLRGLSNTYIYNIVIEINLHFLLFLRFL